MLQVMVALVLVQDYLVAKEELALSLATPLALVCNKHKERLVMQGLQKECCHI